MQNFEILRNITIGQYIPTGSVVHRLDPRAKIMAAGFLILAISFTTSILANLICLAVLLAITLIARLPLRYLWRGLMAALPVFAFIFVMQLLFLGWSDTTGPVYFEWRFVRITQNTLHQIIISLMRIISFIFLTSLVTMTSTTTELAHGVERLLSPLQRIGVPAHELALILTIALRFVPTLAEELERIMKAQASRGGEFGTLRIWRPDQMARAYLPLIVPLFLAAFRRAEDLVLAMEARGYMGGMGRTRFVQLRARPLDIGVVAVSFGFMLFILFFPFPPVSSLIDFGF